MKKSILMPPLLTLLAACSSPADQTGAPVPEPAAPSARTDSAPPSTATSASAIGVVESVDPAAKTVTITHGPVAALQWPAMTMTFKAPDADLAAIKPGDEVSFEFTSSGMDGTITAISHD